MATAKLHREQGTQPHKILGAAEMLLAPLESAYLTMRRSCLTKQLPNGDGHSVILIPGFLGGDSSLFTLRDFLRSLNYDAHTWGAGVNFGAREELVDKLMHKVETVLADNGGTSISLIGQSLGGVFAREVARLDPDAVRQVISLGSPFMTQETEKEPPVAKLYKAMNPGDLTDKGMYVSDPSAPLEGVNSTSIFSKADGVVHWSNCVDADEGEGSENIEVPGSHSGMSTSAAVYHVIADRLAQPEAEWQPYEPHPALAPVVKPHTD